MARLSDGDKKRLVTDLMAGTQSVRQLAKKYGVSNATIQNYKEEIDPQSEQVINAGVAYRTGLAQIEDQQKVNAIVNAVDERTKHIQFLNNATLKNVATMMKKIDEKTTIYDHKLVQDTIAKGKEVLIGKEADTSVTINNTNTNANAMQYKPQTVEDASKAYLEIMGR